MIVSLAVASAAEVRAQDPCLPVDIALGVTQQGALEVDDCTIDELGFFAGDESFVDPYRVMLPTDGLLTVGLGSDSFDAFVDVTDDGLSGIDSDNDGGSGTDAVIPRLPLCAGTYLILANSALEGETGPYTLRTSFTPSPQTPGSVVIHQVERRIAWLTQSDIEGLPPESQGDEVASSSLGAFEEMVDLDQGDFVLLLDQTSSVCQPSPGSIVARGTGAAGVLVDIQDPGFDSTNSATSSSEMRIEFSVSEPSILFVDGAMTSSWLERVEFGNGSVTVADFLARTETCDASQVCDRTELRDVQPNGAPVDDFVFTTFDLEPGRYSASALTSSAGTVNEDAIVSGVASWFADFTVVATPEPVAHVLEIAAVATLLAVRRRSRRASRGTC